MFESHLVFTFITISKFAKVIGKIGADNDYILQATKKSHNCRSNYVSLKTMHCS